MNHFVVTRKLYNVSEAVGEYTIRNEVVKEMLEEVLAMAEVDYMVLKSTFIHDKTLFLIFAVDTFSAFPVTPYENKRLEEKFKEKQRVAKIPKTSERKAKTQGRKT